MFSIRLPIGQNSMRNSGNLSILNMKKSFVLSDRGLYHLTMQYSQLAIEPELWLKMRPDQRLKAVKQFESSSVSTSKVSSCRKLSFTTEIGGSSSSKAHEDHNQSIRTNTKSKKSCSSTTSSNNNNNNSNKKSLGISAADSGIIMLPLVTLQMMWQKADELLNSKNAITWCS